MLSRITFFLSVALMCFASFIFHPRWKMKGGEATISWDVSGYYWYLPSLFIYHDIKHQSFKDDILNKYGPTNNDFQQAFPTGNGSYVLKYSSGMAVMYLPFFAVAHTVANPLGYPADGFSRPYQFCIQLGGLLVAVLGLWYLRKLLLLFYNDKVVAATLLFLVFATNYLNYAAIDCGMSHSWLFTLYVFLLLNSHYFHQTYKTKYAVRAGLLVGLATLTRPSDMLSALIPLLWGMESIKPAAVKARITLLMVQYRPLLLAVLCAACVIAIQPLYWKMVSGHWLVYSYQDQHLYFRSPNFFNYTLSYRSGWLVYTPAMLLAFLGLLPFWRHGRNRVAVTSFFLLNYYVVCAWSIWWYGGRAMVQSYPVLLFPVAALFASAFKRKVTGMVWIATICFFIYFNTWVTYQAHAGGLLGSEDVNEAYFWQIAGRWKASPETQWLKDNPDQLLKPRQELQLPALHTHDVQNDTGATIKEVNGRRQIYLTMSHQLSDTYKFPVTGAPGDYITAAARVYFPKKEWDLWKMAQFIVRTTRKGERTAERMIRMHRLVQDGETATIYIDIKVPQGGCDTAEVLMWNGGSNEPIAADHLQVWLKKASKGGNWH